MNFRTLDPIGALRSREDNLEATEDTEAPLLALLVAYEVEVCRRRPRLGGPDRLALAHWLKAEPALEAEFDLTALRR